jgi:PAS domain S-box-containing protein
LLVEELMQDSQENYRVIAELVSDTGYVVQVEADGSLVPTWVSRASSFHPNGADDAELVGLPWLEFVHPTDRELLQKQLCILFAGHEAEFELRVVLTNGEVRWLRLNNRPIFDPTEARVVKIVGAVNDITRQKAAEQALAESEARHRALVENSLQAILVIEGPPLRITYANEACETVFGRTREELGDLSSEQIESLIHPADRSRVMNELTSLLSGGRKPIRAEFRLIRRDYSIGWLACHAGPIQQGGSRAVQAVLMDVTERKQTEQEVLQYRSDLQEMVAQRTVELAQANERLRHEIVERKQAEQALQLRNRELTLLQQASRVFSSSLDVNRVLSTVLEEVRNLLAVDACSIWLVDPETGELIRRQGAGLKDDMLRGWRLPPGQGLAGWAASRRESLVVHDATTDERHFTGVDEFTGVEMRSILCVPLQIKDTVIGVIQILDKAAGRFETKDLELVEALAAPAAIAIENARLYEETSELQIFNETIVQSMEEGIVLFDQQDVITFVNPKTTELLAFSQEDLVGMRWRSLLPPGGRARQGDRGAVRYETELITRDGDRLPVIVSARPLFEGNVRAGSLAVFTDISDLKAAERALRQNMELLEQRVRDRTRELSVLYRVTAIASESLDLSAGLARSLDEMLSAVDSSAGAIHLLDETDQTLRLAVEQGLEPGLMTELEVAPVSTSLPGLAIQRREPVVVQDPADGDGRVAASYLGVPIRAGGSALGVLSIFGGREERLTAEEIAVLSSAADHIGVAVENARLRQRAEHAAAMEERERLAQDLHDSVTQSLYSLALFTKVALELARRGDLERLESNLLDATESAQQALKEMRLLVHQLRPSVLRQEGLVGALRQRLEAVEKRSGVDGRLEVDGMQELAESTEMSLYLIGLEALNNALKHARASTVTVRLRFAPDAVHMEIEDDGRGFDLHAAADCGGMGLTNMAGRAARLGGSLDILTSQGAGTRIHVTAPLP